ncbi:hypothetical protein BJX68DRAFT_257858 [Aspergillus pseudodeflectus]|uniref:Sugar phosphate phosphatase n=1 Tax=Aspergillus pseudodeflectus TaxID=176178 RepID=A0ABR4JQL9_9EURO
MEFDPQIPSYLTSDLSSFAHVSDGIINDLTETVNGVLDAMAEAEGKRVIDGVVALKADILSDAKLTLKLWERLMTSTFKSSRPAVLELVTKYRELVSGDTYSQREDAEVLLFHEMCEVCLWGNATELSVLTSLTYEDLQKLQVDFVLDYAVFEVFADLNLAGYLLSTRLATKIVLHPKWTLWLVSDALAVDFNNVLAALLNPRAFFRTQAEMARSKAEEQSLGNQWCDFYQKGKIVLKTHDLVILKGDLNYTSLQVTYMLLFTYSLTISTTTNMLLLGLLQLYDPFLNPIGRLGPVSGRETSTLLRLCI